MHIAASLMTVMARPSCTTVRCSAPLTPRAPSPPRPAQSEASSSTRVEQRALVYRHLFGRPTKKAKPPPKSAAQSFPVESGDHVQEFKVKWSRTKKFYTEPVKE